MNLEAYQVDHLFLLVGENPLPNCVAAMTLLRAGGTPYLVHTTFTRGQAECLRGVLNDVPQLQPAQLLSLGDQHSNAYHIRKCIQERALPLQGRIGMNYTGGTKAMAVHAYRALQDQPEVVFSYLDSQRLAMCFDSEQGNCVAIRVSPKLSFAQLFQLHGLSWRDEQPPIADPILPAAAQAFAHLHQDAAIAKAWRDWCHRELCNRHLQNDAGYWREEAALAQLPSLSLDGLPQSIKQVLHDYLDASESQLSLQAVCRGRFELLRQMCEWLNGIWLEHYVLQQVQQIAPTYEVHESKMSFRIKDPQKPHLKWEKFEFDVALMRDYQLFALSCTTSAIKSRCKEKLFEASLRARQMGGTESRVALVCCYDHPEYVKSDLEVLTRNRKLAVFGRQDLGNLAEKIGGWIRQNA